MKMTAKVTVAAMALACLSALPEATAQRNYDPKTAETIQGKVLSVEKAEAGRGGSYGVHLTLQTEKEQIAVHLGPAWYVEKQPLRIEANDAITVNGSRVTMNGKPAIIAAEVRKGSEVLKLRDKDGVPVWSGRGRRGM